MLPVSDGNPTRTTPYVNYALISLNVLAFVVMPHRHYLQLEGVNSSGFVILAFGYAPLAAPIGLVHLNSAIERGIQAGVPPKAFRRA